jgi:16S rRNA (guanine966-N2)-methyltransferase
MLEARQAIEGARTLDLYAGTGALGIEALSRGAAWADFVERSPRLCAVIRENLERTGFRQQAQVLALPAARAVETLAQERYDLVFMDPPYEENAALESVVQALLRHGMVRTGGMMVVEQGARTTLDFARSGLRAVQQKRYGDTAVSLYAVEGDPA